MVGYHQTNQKTDTGKTLTRWPVLVDHNNTVFFLCCEYLKNLCYVVTHWHPQNTTLIMVLAKSAAISASKTIVRSFIFIFLVKKMAAQLAAEKRGIKRESIS